MIVTPVRCDVDITSGFSKFNHRVIEMKIQGALGKNLKTNNAGLSVSAATYADIGQAVMGATQEYLAVMLAHDDGSSLADSIHSKNLAESAKFSARSARIAYLLGKVTLLGERDRKSVVRNQIIEYGAVAEAILVDLIQSVGVNDLPAGARAKQDSRKTIIDWANGGLFKLDPKKRKQQLEYKFEFFWLISEALRMGAIDSKLRDRLTWLRESRNLVHAVIPTHRRYSDDVSSSRHARNIVVDLRDACKLYKANHGLP